MIKISKRSFERIKSSIMLTFIMVAIILITGIILLSQSVHSYLANISLTFIILGAAIMALICCYDIIEKLNEIKENQQLEEVDDKWS